MENPISMKQKLPEGRFKNFMNEFLLLVVVVIYLAISLSPPRGNEKLFHREPEDSNEASRTSAHVLSEVPAAESHIILP
jgi:hypothetical protein